jgi:hypothetical protein
MAAPFAAAIPESWLLLGAFKSAFLTQLFPLSPLQPFFFDKLSLSVIPVTHGRLFANKRPLDVT